MARLPLSRHGAVPTLETFQRAFGQEAAECVGHRSPATLCDKCRIYLSGGTITLGVPLYAVVPAAGYSLDGAVGRIGRCSETWRKLIDRLVMAVGGRDGFAFFKT